MGVDSLYVLYLDGLARNPKTPSSVIPAEAGIQEYQNFWTPAFAGVTA
jgi:hypothetical protein